MIRGMVGHPTSRCRLTTLRVAADRQETLSRRGAVVGRPVCCACRAASRATRNQDLPPATAKQEHLRGVPCCGQSRLTFRDGALTVLVLPDSIPCSCIGVVGC